LLVETFLLHNEIFWRQNVGAECSIKCIQRVKKHPHRQHHVTQSSQRHSSFSRRCIHFMLHSAPIFCRQNISLCNKKSLPTSTEAPRHKRFLFFKILKVQNFWALFWGQFWDPGLLPPFSILSCGLGLNYIISPDVSITFPPSLFTVMPKGLTTGPKSRLDRTWPYTTNRPSTLSYNSKSMTWLGNVVYFFVDYLPEVGRKRPKNAGGLIYDCILLCRSVVQLE